MVSRYPPARMARAAAFIPQVFLFRAEGFPACRGLFEFQRSLSRLGTKSRRQGRRLSLLNF
jgi:hypothetical protein